MTTTQWNPGSLLTLSGSYWQAFTLHASVKLDIFTQLNQGALSADEMAERLEADRRGTTMLLNALTLMLHTSAYAVVTWWFMAVIVLLYAAYSALDVVAKRTRWLEKALKLVFYLVLMFLGAALPIGMGWA